jgi:hypothetical protein
MQAVLDTRKVGGMEPPAFWLLVHPMEGLDLSLLPRWEMPE